MKIHKIATYKYLKPSLNAVRRILTLAMLSYLASCSTQETIKPKSITKSKVTYAKKEFKQLKGWNQDQAEGLRDSLVNSCQVYLKKRGKIKATSPIFGTYENWHPLCGTLKQIPNNQLKTYFEKNLNVYQLNAKDRGLFTGYYIPTIPGSKVKTERFSVPVLKQPKDMVQLKLSTFELKRKSSGNSVIQGKVNEGWVIPYDDRATINKKISQGVYDDDILVWLEDRIERFFLQIQGSGIVTLEDGSVMHIAYAGRNGHSYSSIGAYLRDHENVKKLTTQDIKQWLHDHPEKLDSVLNRNKLFIFFKENKDNLVRGSQHTPLVAEHSAAVDTRYIPLGTPLFIDTTLSKNNTPFRRAMTAQDVGTAIKGVARADIYFGIGDNPGALAGAQKANGKMYAFIPK